MKQSDNWNAARLLVVDDDRYVRNLLEDLFADRVERIALAETAQQAMELFEVVQWAGTPQLS